MDEARKRIELRAATRGDQDALQRLLVHYHASLHGVVTAAMDGPIQRRVDPEDILQDAYISAYRSVPGMEFDGPGHFYKWLERVILNTLVDAQRHAGRSKRDIAREVSTDRDSQQSRARITERLAATDPSPSRALRVDEASAAVMTCLARLSEDHRTVIRLRILADLPVAEIALQMSKTEIAIYALTRRALKALHDLMGPITVYLTEL